MSTAKENTPQINIFIAYAKEDYKCLKELRKQLDVACKRMPHIKVWHDEQLLAGSETTNIVSKLEDSNIIIILISADFLNSDFCWEVLLQKALEKNEQEENCWLVPVFTKHCDLEDLPFEPEDFLPKNAVPITDKYWKKKHSKEKPYLLVVKGTKKIISNLKAKLEKGEKADDASEQTATAQAELPKTGKVLYRIPATMQMGKMQKCIIRIAPDEVEEKKLFERLKFANRAKLEKGIELGEVMKVELEDTNQAFDVKLVGSEESSEQKISNFGFTEWKFEVTPLKPGTHTLYMRVSIAEHLDKHGKKYHNSITLDKEIKVKTQPLAQEEKMPHWEEHRKSISYKFGNDPASKAPLPGPRPANPLQLIRGAARIVAAIMVLPFLFALSLSASAEVRKGWAEILHGDYTVCYETTLTDENGERRKVMVVKTKEGKKGYLNQYGKTILEPVYDEIKQSKADGKTLVKKNGKWGVVQEVPKSPMQKIPIIGKVVETKDQLVAPPIFDDIEVKPNAKTKQNELHGKLQGKNIGKIPLKNPKKVAAKAPSPLTKLDNKPEQIKRIKEADSLLLSGNKNDALKTLRSLQVPSTSPEDAQAVEDLIDERKAVYEQGEAAVEELSEAEFAELLYGLETPQTAINNSPNTPNAPLVGEVPQTEEGTADLLITLKPPSLNMDAAQLETANHQAKAVTQKLETEKAALDQPANPSPSIESTDVIYNVSPPDISNTPPETEKPQTALDQPANPSPSTESTDVIHNVSPESGKANTSPSSGGSAEAPGTAAKGGTANTAIPPGFEGTVTEGNAPSSPLSPRAKSRGKEDAAGSEGKTDKGTDVIHNVSLDLPDPITELINNMVYIQGGTFTMGCDEKRDDDCADDEKPTHSVTLSGYSIGKYEVTQAQWRAVMGSDPEELRFKGCDNCPVERVSWNDIQEFLKELNKKTGKKFRLPTEAEWEYAARGGNVGTDHAPSKYAGGNDLDAVAWYGDNSGSKTHPVGQKQPNELGLYDMNGNVWEWCSDRYDADYYANSPRSNPRGPNSGARRVLRGGGWDNGAGSCRAANRHGSNPNDRISSYGFRPAHSLE